MSFPRKRESISKKGISVRAEVKRASSKPAEPLICHSVLACPPLEGCGIHFKLEIELRRVFFGIGLPGNIQQDIYKLAESLAIPKARVTPAENLHLTLRFIGNADDEKIEFFIKRLEKVCKKFKPLEMKLGEVGAFSSLKKARVVWIGLSHGAEEVKELAWETEKAARKLDFKEEKRFHPHITFARLKFPQDVTDFIASNQEAAKKLNSKSIKVDKITLFESQLHPTGASYSVLHEFPLG